MILPFEDPASDLVGAQPIRLTWSDRSCKIAKTRSHLIRQEALFVVSKGLFCLILAYRMLLGFDFKIPSLIFCGNDAKGLGFHIRYVSVLTLFVGKGSRGLDKLVAITALAA